MPSKSAKKLTDRRPHAVFTIQGILAKFLVDSGASKSLISSKFLSKFKRGFCVKTVDVNLESVTGDRILTDGLIDLSVDNVGPQNFVVLPTLEIDGILGIDFLEKYNVAIDFSRKEMRVKGKTWSICQREVYGKIPKIGRISEIVEIPEWLDNIQNHQVFRDELGHCQVGEPIHIKTEGPPIKQRPYRQPLLKRKLVEDEIDKMLAAGVIRPSNSPWASPITLTPKKDGSQRFCVDLRRVNAVTVRDSYPIPSIQGIFDTLNGSSVFTTLDLRSGYWQVDLDAESIPKTAFVCHRGLFEFLRLPFGLTNAPGQFQRLMDYVLGDLIGKVCLVYLDDIIIFSKTKAEHKRHVQMVLDKLDEAGLTVKMKKCEFGKSQVELLGYTVSAEGIAPQAQKVEVIKGLESPNSKKEVKSFLGMTGNYRQCIPNYAYIAEPLVALTRDHIRFYWSEKEEEAFQKLKQELCSRNVMAYPDPEKPYILHTDASDYAVGAILTQEQDGIDRPIQYVSKQLCKSQRAWAPIVKEAFAIIFALKKL